MKKSKNRSNIIKENYKFNSTIESILFVRFLCNLTNLNTSYGKVKINIIWAYENIINSTRFIVTLYSHVFHIKTAEKEQLVDYYINRIHTFHERYDGDEDEESMIHINIIVSYIILKENERTGIIANKLYNKLNKFQKVYHKMFPKQELDGVDDLLINPDIFEVLENLTYEKMIEYIKKYDEMRKSKHKTPINPPINLFSILINEIGFICRLLPNLFNIAKKGLIQKNPYQLNICCYIYKKYKLNKTLHWVSKEKQNKNINFIVKYSEYHINVIEMYYNIAYIRQPGYGVYECKIEKKISYILKIQTFPELTFLSKIIKSF